ncbi:MAG: acetate/propionate family kinase [Patescibacteria group bacterium]
MSILVINSGSTSVKYKIFDEKEKQLKEGCFNNVENREKVIKEILREIPDISQIAAIGHRVVHGGDKFKESVIVNDEVILELEKYNKLAPLHNPYNISGLKACQGFLPNLTQVAVFDTAFYHNLPEIARTYALPKQITAKYNIKRFGFHGISHQYVLEEASKQLKIKQKGINLITCHLGGGWSITAIKNGQVVDTSMGWTPLEGLMMMSRAGDIDPGIILELMRIQAEEELTNEQFDLAKILNYDSGIKAISEGITDYQDLLREVSHGEKNAKLAFDLTIYKLVKYIGAYWAVLEGKVEAIVFTGAIGAGNPMTRNQVVSKIKFLGEVPVLAVKTNEELMIAREVKKLLDNRK